jgi:hypothetical protein
MDQSESLEASVNSPDSDHATGEPEVKTIVEKELIENFENAAVKSLVIDETSQGYVVHVTLTWRKDGPLLLVKYRSLEARAWQNLNTLANYLKELPNVPPLVVRLLPPPEKKKHDPNRKDNET